MESGVLFIAYILSAENEVMMYAKDYAGFN